MTTCPAALNIEGEHYPCDTPDDPYTGEVHGGWIHGNQARGAIWCGADAPTRLPDARP